MRIARSDRFCYIDRNVVIGDNNTLMNSVTVLYGARIGNGNRFFPGCVIGAVPQDLKFRGEETTAEIGDNNTFRENVTVNRGTAAKNRTVVGSGNLLMESVHIAHDDIVGNECIIGNGTKLAGEVTIDDKAIISANVLVHQFCRIGGYCMVGGGTRTAQDILPFLHDSPRPGRILRSEHRGPAPPGLRTRHHRQHPQDLPDHPPGHRPAQGPAPQGGGRDTLISRDSLHPRLHTHQQAGFHTVIRTPS